MSGGRRKVSSPSGTQAVDRAARLLTEVVHSPGAVTFTELAAATGLAKSTTSRLLFALERNGLVRRDEAGRFRPGEVFIRFAWRGGAEAGLTEVAQPYLDRLGEATGETVNLGVGRDGMVEQIAQVDSVYLIGGTNWLGRAVPLHCSAAGKVLLATAWPSCRRAGSSGAPTGASPAGRPWRRSLPPSSNGVTRSSTANWNPVLWRWPPPSTATAAPWSPRCRCRDRGPG